MLTVGSLFAGIGGLELGLERTGGFRTVWQVEIDDYAQRVLAKHWPAVTRWDDVRTWPHPNTERVDVICGGFPCQPFSHAARGRNNAEDMWPEMLRVIAIVGPRIVLAENVTKRAIRKAEKDLEALGYNTSCASIGANEVGSDHIRNRWWLFAHSDYEVELHSPVDAKVAFVQEIRRSVWGWSCFAERCGVSDGVSDRVDRLRCLGNAVVPQVAEFIGRMVLDIEAAKGGRDE